MGLGLGLGLYVMSYEEKHRCRLSGGVRVRVPADFLLLEYEKHLSGESEGIEALTQASGEARSL